MASNKNQHFVPRCYLRSFAVIGADAAINLYNIDRQKFIQGAPLKHQCSGDYFYGRDAELEKGIQAVEIAYADVLRNISNPGYILSNDHRSVLRYFWLLQHLRTEAASKRSVEMNESMMRTSGISDQHPDYRLEIREAVQIAMRAFAQSMYIVDDLKICLIKNRTGVAFITSDDPAVLTNRWHLQTDRTRGRSFGPVAAGTLLFLPLTARVLCLGYDGDVYSVPNQQGWADIRRDQDAEAFNEHQFLNCRANIFLQDPADSVRVHEAFLGALCRRPGIRHRTHYAILDGADATHKRYKVVDPATASEHEEAIIHMQVVHAHPASWPSIITWRPKGVIYTNDTGVGHVREAMTYRGDRRPFRKEFAR
jgi:hypothetical protein